MPFKPEPNSEAAILIHHHKELSHAERSGGSPAYSMKRWIKLICFIQEPLILMYHQKRLGHPNAVCTLHVSSELSRTDTH